MLEAKISITGINEMQKKLAEAKEKAKRPVGFTEYVAAKAYKEVIKHFQDESGPDGKWEPLSPETILRRRKGGGGAKILQDTRAMMLSIVPTSEKNKVHIICNKEYGIIHQNGTSKVPQRKFLWVGDDFLKKMAELYSKFVKGKL